MTIGFSVLPFDSTSIIVRFDEPVDNSALLESNYVLSSIGSGTHIPFVSMISFNNASNSDVLIRFTESFTLNKGYYLTISMVVGANGVDVAAGTEEFTSVAPDAPRPIGAYVSGLNQFDIVYNHPVAPFNSGTISSIRSVGPNTFVNASQVAWSPGLYPVNNLRYQISGHVGASDTFTVLSPIVSDISLNNSATTFIPLTTSSRASLPLNAFSFENIQITNAHVSHISIGHLNSGYICVYFNGPTLTTDLLNPAKWGISQTSSHNFQDSINNISTPVVLDLSDMITFAIRVQTDYTNHLAYVNVHANAALPPSESGIVTLANEMLAKLRAHSVSFSVHGALDPNRSLDDVKPVKTLHDAILLLNALKVFFGLHQTSYGLHQVDDTNYIVYSPDATDLATAVTLVDELKIKLYMHMSSPVFHLETDFVNLPQSAFVGQRLSCETPIDVLTCASAIDEVQLRYLQHISDGWIHLYSDTVNTFALNLVYITLAELTSDNYARIESAAINFSTYWNRHLLADYPVTIKSIRDFTGVSQSDVVDAYSNMCVIEVTATSPVPSYSVTATIHSADSSTVTDPGFYTGSVVAKPLSEQFSLMSGQSLPDGKFIARFDREVVVRNLSDYKVSPINGVQQSFISVHPYASIQTLNLLTIDVFNAYSVHLQLAGHKIVDVVNVLLTSDYPQGNLVALMTSLNTFKNHFNNHASSVVYHQRQIPFPITLPDAVNYDSAFELALALKEAYLVHNADLGLHTSSSPDMIAAPNTDGLILDMGGACDGVSYSITVPVSDRQYNLSGTSFHSYYLLKTSLLGISDQPVLTAVAPVSGLVTNQDGTMSLGSDTLEIFFSKPMKQSPLFPINLTISDPSVVLGQATWTSSRSAKIVVKNLNPVSYTLSVSQITDTFGNLISP